MNCRLHWWLDEREGTKFLLFILIAFFCNVAIAGLEGPLWPKLMGTAVLLGTLVSRLHALRWRFF